MHNRICSTFHLCASHLTHFIHLSALPSFQLFRYYYNTVTKRSTWIAPRFSANWMKDRERKEDSNKKKRSIFRLGFKSKQAVRLF